MAEQIERNGA